MSEIEINGRVYPATTQATRVARCYVCNDVRPKTMMVMAGPSVSPMDMDPDDRLYIWRCEDCYAGSAKWLKHFMHNSSVGRYYKGIVEVPKDPEQQKAIGRMIVAKRRSEIEGEIARRLDAKKEGADAPKREMPPAKKAGARSKVLIQKSKGRPAGRSARVVRSRVRSLL